MDTPRTDAERFTVRVQDSTMRSLPVEVVHASFADKLERESAAFAAALQDMLIGVSEGHIGVARIDAAVAALSKLRA